MAEKGNYQINWGDFTTTSAERFQDLVGKKEFSDVTLVAGDGSRIPSHQVILASGSTFFKKLLVEEASKNPLIFLRGVEVILLEPLLNFLYTGSAEVNEDLITQFVALAEDLGVDGLADPIEAPDTTNQEKTENDKAEVAKIIAETLADTKKELSLKNRSDNFSKQCEKCLKVFNSRSNLIKHIRLHDKPTKKGSLATMIKLPDRDNDGLYQCFDCDYKVKCNSNFKRHVQKHHLKIDFKCDKCNFQHKEAGMLSKHRKIHKLDVTV